jgi:hypothetical protein
MEDIPAPMMQQYFKIADSGDFRANDAPLSQQVNGMSLNSPCLMPKQVRLVEKRTNFTAEENSGLKGNNNNQKFQAFH